MDIYQRHDSAFAGITACVVTLHGARVATIAFKRNQRSGGVQCFLHWFGETMTRGTARGGGYDMCSAAAADAARRLPAELPEDSGYPLTAAERTAFRSALLGTEHNTWRYALRDAGFEVLSAIG